MTDEKKVARVIATPAAIELIDKLRAEHGDVIFHQSGGCCDGSAPMMFPKNEFMVGGSDVKLGFIAGVVQIVAGGPARRPDPSPEPRLAPT